MNRKERQAGQQGFTLFEMAIVILTIGLLIGSIMVGKDLFATARNRSVIKEARLYQDAVHSFELKYDELPGDMLTPVDIWSTESWSGNGNGDGTIVWTYEGPEAWRQLELAGFLQTSGMSIACTTACAANPGVNVPRSTTFSSGGWTIGVNNRTGNNILLFGTYDGTSIGNHPVLTGKEAWYIDKKVDDGNPNAGSFRARNSWGYTVCINGSDSTTYNLTTNNPVCNFDITLGL